MTTGDHVECFRTSTPDVIEWTGVIEKVRGVSGSFVVIVDDFKIRTGLFAGQPLRVPFSAAGDKMGHGGQGPPFRIRPAKSIV